MLGLILFVAIWPLMGRTQPVTVSTIPPSNVIPEYDTFEIVMANGSGYANPWAGANAGGVTIACQFTSPTSAVKTVRGFYYDSGIWRCRFAPEETGTYGYTISFTNRGGTFTATGSLTSTPGSNKGFLRTHGTNRRSLVTEGDGRKFFGLGIQDVYRDAGTSPAASGVNRTALDGIWDVGYQDTETSHACYNYDGSSAGPCSFTASSITTWFTNFAAAGYNLWRNNGENIHEWANFNPGGNGTFQTNLNYEKNSVDVAIQAAHAAGFHITWCMDNAPSSNTLPGYDLTNTNNRNAFYGLWDYVVARYGSYVDIWEVANESNNESPQPGSSTISQIATHINGSDPYNHLIGPGSANYAVPGITVGGPHGYWSTATLALDHEYAAAVSDSGQNVYGGMAAFKGYYTNLPLFWGEQGDACGRAGDTTPRDHTRIRTYFWVALLNEFAGVIGWNGGRDSTQTCAGTELANMWEGPLSRQYAQVVSQVASGFDPLATPAAVTVPANTRCYAMGGAHNLIAYCLNTASRSSDLGGRSITLTVPESGLQGKWIDPATGTVLSTFLSSSGPQSLTIPANPGIPDIVLSLAPGVRHDPRRSDRFEMHSLFEKTV